MPDTPTFPSIPVPKEDLKSILETVLTLKRTVEMLTGQDPASPQGDKKQFFAPHVFVQAETPEAYHIGDLWLAQRKSWSFSIWTGTDWIMIADLPTPTPVVTRGYFKAPGFIRRHG